MTDDDTAQIMTQHRKWQQHSGRHGLELIIANMHRRVSIVIFVFYCLNHRLVNHERDLIFHSEIQLDLQQRDCLLSAVLAVLVWCITYSMDQFRMVM